MVKGTKTAQETQTQEEPDRTMMPCREPAHAQPDWRESLDAHQTPLRAKRTIYQRWQGPLPIQMQIFKSIIGTYSVLTVSITKRKRAFKWSHQRNRSYSHFAALHQLNEVSEKDVSVPLAETLSVIGHLQQRRAQREKKEKA